MTVTLSDLHLERTLRLNVKDEFEECKDGGKETSQQTAHNAVRDEACLTQPRGRIEGKDQA